jgi:hypothetical protein
MRTFAKTGILTTTLLVAVVVGVPTFALGAPDAHANAQATEVGQPTDPGSQAGDHKAAVGTKLAAAKLRACQNREKAVNNIMSRIADRGQKQLDLFTTIATRTEKFYTDKGKTLSNYDALVAEVTAKKDAAQTTVDTVKADSTTFKCDGTDPKGAVATFKDALKSEIAALKAYKTSVKNLIVGVKSVQATVSTDTKTTGGTE